MRKKKVRGVIFFLLVPLIIFLLIHGFNQFRIKKVYIISSRQISNGLDMLNSQNLLTFNTIHIRQYLLQQNPEVKSIDIKIKFPESLIMILVFRQPVAMVRPNTLKPYYLDSEGVILSTNEDNDQDIPVIETNGILSGFGSRIDWRIMKALLITKYFAKENLPVDKILIDDKIPTLDILLKDGIKAVVPEASDPPTLAASLQIITSRFRIEGKSITAIDFRFEKPVVIFSTGEKISSQ